MAGLSGGAADARGTRQNHLLEVDAKRAPGPTWETVRYMVAAIQYGGRITDEFDKFLMQTYAERYFHQVPGPPMVCWLGCKRIQARVYT